MNHYRKNAVELRAHIEQVPELHELFLSTYPAIWDYILVLTTPEPCELEMVCDYVRALDKWVTWVDAWFELNVPSGDKENKKPKPTWPPEG